MSKLTINFIDGSATELNGSIEGLEEICNSLATANSVRCNVNGDVVFILHDNITTMRIEDSNDNTIDDFLNELHKDIAKGGVEIEKLMRGENNE